MTRGRKPKPTADKKYRGNPGKQKLPENEPKPSDWGKLKVTDGKLPKNMPPYPDGLSDEAQIVWRRVTPDAVKMGVFKPVDEDAMVVFCEAVAQYRRARTMIIKAGDVTKTPQGFVQKNPFHTVLRDAISTIDKFGAKFGFSPADRVRITLENVGDEDELAKFIKEGEGA